MNPITTHVLDTSLGKPAKGVPITLLKRTYHRAPKRVPSGREAEYLREEWDEIASGVTNADGRLGDWLPKGFKLQQAVYELKFDTGAYFKKRKVAGFYPEATIVFEIRRPKQHYHVPLLLNPFGYSTYRGS